MNKYEKGQQIPISGIITITGVQKNKSGNFVYSTDRGCTIPELLIERLEMKPYGTPYYSAEPVPQQEDKPKYKVGDKVKVIARTCGHLASIGDVITLKDSNVTCEKNAWHFKEENGYITENDFEPYAEPMKLYCTKDYRPGEWVTKGKIYEVDADGIIKFDDGYSTSFDGMPKPNSITDPLVHLVKREAQAGKWIYAVHKDRFDYYEIGQIMQVSARFDCGGGLYAVVEGDSKEHQLYDGEYLVLDGYIPEPEYLNMKVVCTDDGYIKNLTVGKLYEIKNGFFINDAGRINPLKTGALNSLEDLNTRHAAKFIEFKGE